MCIGLKITILLYFTAIDVWGKNSSWRCAMPKQKLQNLHWIRIKKF